MWSRSSESLRPAICRRLRNILRESCGQRHLVECCFSKLKQARRVAVRFEKMPRNYVAVITIAAIVLWLRSCPQFLRRDETVYLVG